jgi:SNF2 family DNA or RNA helicase
MTPDWSRADEPTLDHDYTPKHAQAAGLQLMPYQQAGVEALLDHPALLLADDMGLGKTPQAIAAARGCCVVVICPKAVAFNWRREVARWAGADAAIIVGTEAGEVPSATWLIVPYSIIKERHPDLPDPTTLIIDECHFLKNPKAKRTKAVVKLGKRAKRIYALTGTPMPNRTRELQPILDLLGCYWAKGLKFLKRYCDPTKIWDGRKWKWIHEGSSHTRELAELLRDSVMMRRTKAQVLRDLPIKRREKAYLDPTTYKGPLAEAGELPEFEDLSAVRAEQALAKADQVAEYLAEAGDPPALVFCHHKEVAEALAQALGCAYVHGGLTAAEQDARIQAFVKSGLYIVGTIGTLGTGVDGLQHRSHVAYFAELDWTPGNLDQAEDRLCRFGQTQPVRIIHLLMPGTLDDHIIDTLTAKQANITATMEDQINGPHP